MGYKNVKKEWPDCDLQTCRLNDKTPPERSTSHKKTHRVATVGFLVF